MNPLIEFYKKTRNEDGVLKEEFIKIDVAVFSKQILELIQNASEADLDEFLAWNSNPPPADWKEQVLKAAEERNNEPTD